jgi:hypothetical protein
MPATKPKRASSSIDDNPAQSKRFIEAARVCPLFDQSRHRSALARDELLEAGHDAPRFFDDSRPPYSPGWSASVVFACTNISIAVRW